HPGDPGRGRRGESSCGAPAHRASYSRGSRRGPAASRVADARDAAAPDAGAGGRRPAGPRPQDTDHSATRAAPVRQVPDPAAPPGPPRGAGRPARARRPRTLVSRPCGGTLITSGGPSDRSGNRRRAFEPGSRFLPCAGLRCAGYTGASSRGSALVAPARADEAVCRIREEHVERRQATVGPGDVVLEREAILVRELRMRVDALLEAPELLAHRDDLAEEPLDRNPLLLRPRLPRLEHQLPPRPALRDLAGDRFLGPKDRAHGLDDAADVLVVKWRHQRGGSYSPIRFPLGAVTVAAAPKSRRPV